MRLPDSSWASRGQRDPGRCEKRLRAELPDSLGWEDHKAISLSPPPPSPAHRLLCLSVGPLYTPPLPSILFCLPPPALVPPRALPHSLPGASHLSDCDPGRVGPEGGQESLGAEGCLGSGLEGQLYSSLSGPRNPTPPRVPFILPSRSVVSRTKGHRKRAPGRTVWMKMWCLETELGCSGSPAVRGRTSPPGS